MQTPDAFRMSTIKSFLFLTLLTLLLLAATSVAAQPVNDDFANATVVTEPLPFFDNVSTLDATNDFDDPDDCTFGPTVWYTYTPSANASIAANTFGSDYDTVLGAYVESDGSLILINCNDDVEGLQSQVSLDVFAGDTYYFVVGAFAGGMGGNLSFAVDFFVPPPPLEFDLSVDRQGSFLKSGEAIVRGTVTCSREAFVDIFVEGRQQVGRFVILGFGSAFVFCDGETPWEATLFSESGFYKGGQLKVIADAFAFTSDGGFASDFEALNVRLNGGGENRGRFSEAADNNTEAALQNRAYPNPFNPKTTLSFTLPEQSDVRLVIFDVRGRQVGVLLDGPMTAGHHEVAFEASDLPSGVYLSRLEVGGKVSSQSLVLLK